MEQILCAYAGFPDFIILIAGQIDQGSFLCFCKDVLPFPFCFPNHLQSFFFGTPDKVDSLPLNLLYSLDLFPYHACCNPLL